MNKYAIVLAAGKGTRMKSLIGDHSKVSFPIMGKPIINYVLDSIKPLGFEETIVIAGFAGETTRAIVGNQAKVVQATEIAETASSVNFARDLLGDKEGLTLIVFGGLPLLTAETLQKVFRKHEKNNNDLTVLTSVLDNPEGYARIIRDHKTNKVLAVKEENKCDEYQLGISEVHSGVYLFNNELLFKYLDKSTYTLSEVVEKFVKAGKKVEAYVLEDAVEMFSINDRVHLAYAAKVIRKRVNHRLMLSGVSFEDPDTAYISPDVEIGPDTIILPNTTILGKTTIGKGNWVGPNSYLNNVSMGDNNTVSFTWMQNVQLGNNVKVEPYTKISDTILKDNQKIKSFTEIKGK